MAIRYILLSVLSTITLFFSGVSVAWTYEAVAVENGGSISGSVKFTGTPPTPEKLEISKDVGVCGQTDKFDESLVVGPQSGLKNVVVSIANIGKGKPFNAGGVLDQKDCVYTPRVVLSPVGTELRILNNDGILHNIRTGSTKNPPVNKPQPKFIKELKETFAQPETMKVICNAHAWMSGWIVVHEHPYYTVTDTDGVFTLTDVPPGEHEVRFWHEVLGETTQKVTIEAGKETKVLTTMEKR
jgi:plastocyanin